MKSFVQTGHTLLYSNSSGSLIPVDSVIVLPGRIAIAAVDIADGDSGSAETVGVYQLAKATGETWAVGDELFWDNSAKKLTKTAASNTRAGTAFLAALTGDTSGQVRLTDSRAKAATVATVATANASDLATAQALANQLKTSVNAILTALKDAGMMA